MYFIIEFPFKKIKTIYIKYIFILEDKKKKIQFTNQFLFIYIYICKLFVCN